MIGPGGRTIKGITERTNTKIDIEDGGIVTIASTMVLPLKKPRRSSKA